MKKIIYPLIVLAGLAVFCSGAWAEEFPLISAEGLKAKMDAGESLLLVNPLSDIEFQESHIPGSINIPLDEIPVTDKLPEDKGMLIVTYCKGPKCIFYKLGAQAIAKIGYTNIVCFRDGMPAWVQAGYPLNTDHAMLDIKVPNIKVDQLKSMLGNTVILDIRAPVMYDMGWISGSRKIPLTKLSERHTELPQGKTVVIVDHLGKQVVSAGRFLKLKGYNDVCFLQGGLMAWVSQGNELVKQE